MIKKHKSDRKEVFAYLVLALMVVGLGVTLLNLEGMTGAFIGLPGVINENISVNETTNISVIDEIKENISNETIDIGLPIEENETLNETDESSNISESLPPETLENSGPIIGVPLPVEEETIENETEKISVPLPINETQENESLDIPETLENEGPLIGIPIPVNETEEYVVENETEQLEENETFENVTLNETIEFNNTTTLENETNTSNVTETPINPSGFIGIMRSVAGNVTVNSTSDTNTSSENLTAYWDISGTDFKNITNWLLNGSSITVLNMPFEGGSVSGGDELQGSTGDYSGYENNGTTYFSATWNNSSGYDGRGAFEFNGTKGYISVSNSNSLNSTNETFTLSLWFNITASPSDEYVIIGQGGRNNTSGWLLTFTSTNTLKWYLDNGTATLSVENSGPTLSNWHHVILLYNKTTSGPDMFVYLDGTLLDNKGTSSEYGGSMFASNESLLIGQQDYSYYLEGTLDDILIFNRSLSAEQIKLLYENRTDIITASETTKNDNWAVCINPNNGTDDGEMVCSVNLTVLNSPPEQGTPTINSSLELNTTSENITVYNVSTSDNDSDSIKNIFDWRLNGSSIMILNMPFEGGSGSLNLTNVTDYSMFKNNGTNVNNVTWNATKGYDGKGVYEFDGFDDFINITEASDFNTGSFTVMAWINTTIIEVQEIISRDDDTDRIFDFQLDIANNLKTFVWNDGASQFDVTSNGAIPTNTWVHVAMSVESNSNTGIKLYVNGVLNNTSSFFEGEVNTGDVNLLIGYRSATGAGVPFKGKIDDVIVFNRTLSADQVKAIYDNRTDLISSDETSKGNNWSACITPNDGAEDGTEVCTENLTVLNTPPETTQVTINATTVNNYTNESLNCYAQFADNDSDQIYANISWYMNSTLNRTNQTGPYSVGSLVLVGTLNASNTTKNDNWSCSVNAYDGTDNETRWLESSTNVTIENTPPETTQVTINATSSDDRPSDNLTCYATFADNDSDTVYANFTWYNSSEEHRSGQSGPYPVGTEVNIANLTSDNTTKGQNWSCAVNAYDGTDNESKWLESSNVTIGNSIPTQGTPTINSTFGTNTSSENITAYNVSTSDLDGDSIKNIFDWRLNGSSIAVLNIPFEGGSTTGSEVLGSTTDYSRNNNNASVYEAVWNSSGGYDGKGVYEFDGVDDFIKIEDDASLNLSNSITISVWVKPQSLTHGGGGNAPRVLEKTSAYMMYISNTGELYFYTYGVGEDEDTSTTARIGLNKWTHIVGTYDNSTGVRKIYLNGSFDTEETGLTGSITMNSNLVYLGDSATDNRQWEGTIDEVMIFNRSLTPEQVWTLYENRTDLINWNETYKNDNWSACITPNDGTEDGTMICTENLTVLNTPPEQGTPTISSSSGTDTVIENITAYNVSTADNDSDVIKNLFDWRLNGSSIAVLNMPFEKVNDSIINATKDYSIFGNDGTEHKGVTWNATGGYDGKGAYEFDGASNQSIKIPLVFDTNKSDLTFIAWVKNIDDDIPEHHIFEQATESEVGRTILSINETNYFATYIGGVTLYSETNISENVWTHVALTYDLDKDTNTFTQKIYINGVLDANNTDSNPERSNETIIIGNSREEAAISFFNGTIDDIMIFNHSLSADQIKSLYDNRTDLISSDETSVGDMWSACITPNDGDEDGSMLCSENLTILQVPVTPPEDDGEGGGGTGTGTGDISTPPDANEEPSEIPLEFKDINEALLIGEPSESVGQVSQTGTGVSKTSRYMTESGTSNISGTVRVVDVILENTGDEVMNLKPKMVEEWEEPFFIIKTKTLGYKDSFFSRMSGINYSPEPIKGNLLKAKLLNPETINLQPGEKREFQFKIKEGISTKSKKIKLFIESFEETVWEKDLTFEEKIIISGSAIDLIEKDKIIDVYTIISPQEIIEEKQRKISSPTGMVIWNEEIETENEYTFEININKNGEKKIDKLLPMKFVFGKKLADLISKERTSFGDIYGPYKIKKNDSIIFAQQMKYDPTRYYGKHSILTKIYKGDEMVAKNEFKVDLGNEVKKIVLENDGKGNIIETVSSTGGEVVGERNNLLIFGMWLIPLFIFLILTGAIIYLLITREEKRKFDW